MAKTLGIRVPAGQNNPDNVDLEVLAPITPVANLGAVVAGMLAASANALLVVVSLGSRFVAGLEMDGLGNQAALDAAVLGADSIGALMGRFALVDETKKTGPWNNTNGHAATLAANNQTAIEQLITHPSKSSFSVSGIVSKMEDEFIKAADGVFTGETEVLMLINQRDKNVSVYTRDGALPVNTSPDEAIGTGGDAWDVIYEQIPADEAAAAEAQWGE